MYSGAVKCTVVLNTTATMRWTRQKAAQYVNQVGINHILSGCMDMPCRKTRAFFRHNNIYMDSNGVCRVGKEPLAQKTAVIAAGVALIHGTKPFLISGGIGHQ